MILQSLAALYEVLAREGKVPADGWAETPVSQEICLDEDGNLLRIMSRKIMPPADEDGKTKGKPRPQMLQMPNWGSAVGSGIRANFLCNQAAYVFGLSDRAGAKPERLAACAAACNKLHHEVLDGVDIPEAKAVLAFLDGIAEGNGVPQDILDTLDKGALASDNFIFSVNRHRVDQVQEIRDAWNTYYENSASGQMVQCLVTGKMAPLAEKHPFVKGLRGAQGSGAGLCTYNAPSFQTFGLEQNANGPVSRHAAYAYTQALTYLLANPVYHKVISDDLTIVWWPESAKEEYCFNMNAAMYGPDPNSENTLFGKEGILTTLNDIVRGRPVGNLSKDEKFYVLGLSGNASRIIVRFFLRNTFGDILTNIRNHYARLELARPDYAKDDQRELTAARAFRAMVREDAKKELPVIVVSQYFQSVLFGTRYPAQMRAMAMDRFQREDGMQWQRVSLIKAYHIQQCELDKNGQGKEKFDVSLQLENREPAYVCGRLFALCEALQSKGLGRKAFEKAPIHGMFAAAMQTPAVVFGRVFAAISVYTGKPGVGWYQKNIQEAMDLLGNEDAAAFPVRFSFAEQGLFSLGYFHQRQAMFHSRKDQDESEPEAAEEQERKEKEQSDETVD